ncbi:MAG: hypothetical protein H0X67_04540 [Acidobacteria bacterium]|nr:hypothetical protein [Acidobacteriota bacterium]
MTTIAGFSYFPLRCGTNGKIEKPAELRALTDHVTSATPTDIIFLGHGFRNDENDAGTLYAEFLQTFSAHVERPEFAGLKARRFAVCALFWPSKTFQESFGEGAVQSLDDAETEKREVRRRLEHLKTAEARQDQRPKIQKAIDLLDTVEDNPAAQDEFVTLVLSLLDDAELDETEGLQKIRAQEGSHLLELLEEPLILPTVPDDSDSDGGLRGVGGDGFDESGQTQGVVSVFGSVFGGIGQFLNLTTWYMMKNRSGTVGANGCVDAVRAVRTVAPSVKVHLVGHSLGGRLMAACARALAEEGAQKVDSLTLLQAAFSHYGLSSTRKGKPGFFRAIIEKQVVRGPLIATYSWQDTVVGKAYAIMSRLANDNVEAIGDQNDEYGGIGRNGAQNAQGSIIEPLHQAGSAYAFSAGMIINLDGTGGLIVDHGDVRNPNVTYAFASAVDRT